MNVLVTAVLLAAVPVRADLDPTAMAKYRDIITKGRNALLAMEKKPGTGEAALAGYALIKSGLEKNHPHVLMLAAATAARVDSGAYGSGPEPPHHVYEAACDTMLLVEVDPVTYRPQLEILRDYLVRKQLPYGPWFYPNVIPNAGDTSITQFAILGLWALTRAGVEVPTATWEKCGRWLLSTQRTDGGFHYHPHAAPARGPSDHGARPHPMTAAGCASMLIIKRMLFGGRNTDEPPPPPPRKRFGMLENLSPERPKKVEAPTLSVEELNRGINAAHQWINQHYDVRPNPNFISYLHYAHERTGALLGTETFGSHHWYDEGARLFSLTQLPGGEWGFAPVGQGGAIESTSFALLFLSRATTTIITPPPAKARLLGGGLLGGGRGLPDDLSKVNISDGQVKKRASQAPIDRLLAELEQPAVEVTEAAQKAVVEAVQLEQRDELVGQVDRLRKLIVDPRPEVRQVACWALGRSDDLRQAPLLIGALMDPDLNVAADASLALCVLSRQPEGIRGLSGKREVLPNEPPEPNEQEDEATYLKRVQAWQKAVHAAWHDWYLRVRPYDERDDRRELRKK